jgi:hypothetical protein
VAVPVGAGRLDAGAATTPTVPPLQSLMIAQPLPGYTVAPTGPTNGPLTATEFGSQSTTPQRAEEQFDALAAAPDFGAFIRLWTDGSGPGQGANDVAVLLFRIPRIRDAESFAAGLAAPFAGSDPFDVPSIPGARGYSVDIASPVRAVEQIVVFRAGQYVSMTELASSTSAANTTALTPSQAVAVSFQQYGSVLYGDPGRSTDARPGPARKVTAGPPGPGVTPAIVLGVMALVVLVAGSLWVIAVRPRRQRRLPWPVAGPWEPGGLFDVWGATIPVPATDSDHARPVPELTSGPWARARMVPTLVPAPSLGPPGARARPSLVARWTDSGANRVEPD